MEADVLFHSLFAVSMVIAHIFNAVIQHCNFMYTIIGKINFLKTAKKFMRIVSSDRSSWSDDGLLYIQQRPLFEIFTHSIDAVDVTIVTLICLNSINAIDVTKC